MRLFAIIVVLLAAVAAAVLFIAPEKIDADMNRVVAHQPYDVSGEARDLHATLRVADLHGDALLWDRNFARRQSRGHMDAVRMREGGFRLQLLAAVTKTPKNLNYDRNTGDTDNITPLVIAQRWPAGTWRSLLQRALHVARRAERVEAETKGALRVVRTGSDLAAALNDDAIALILATEGAHPLEGKVDNIGRLYSAGYRVLGLQHFFDNELGGSLHGVSGEGLTGFGVEAVKAAIEAGMIIDIAHSSEAVARDVLALIDEPVIVSHTGLRGHCNSPRNFSDDLMLKIASHGGLIGVGFWDGAVCEATLSSIAAAIVYAVNLVGVEHVALGSDFDGTTTTPIDASEMAALTDALLAAGLSADTVRAVMGENAIRFFAENLPG